MPRLIRGELDWIVLKAIDKDRSRRYDTASALAMDLRHYLDNEPVTAVRPSPIYRLQKFARRHQVALATAACFALLLTVSAGVAAAQAIKNKSLFTAAEEARLKAMDAQQRETELRRIAEEERGRAEAERGKAEAERDRSQNLLYIANMHLAKQAWDDAKLTRVAEPLDMHRPQPGQPDLRTFEWYYLDRLCHSDLLTLKGHTNEVNQKINLEPWVIRQLIEERSYFYWHSDGCPDNECALWYWLKAKKEILEQHGLPLDYPV